MGFFSKTTPKAKLDDLKINDVKLRDTGFMDFKAGLGRPIKTERAEAAPVQRVAPGMSEQIRDISALKQDLSKISAALRESMRLNQESVSEVANFSNFLKSAEVNAISLERLQPENMELKTNLENARADIAKKQMWASEMESKSLAYKARFEETHQKLENVQSKLHTAEEKLNDERSLRVDANNSLDKNHEENRELRGLIGELKSDNVNLQDMIKRLSESETELLRNKTELIKKAEVLAAKIDDERRDRENAVTDLKALRLDFAELKASHMETMSKFDQARHTAQSNELALSDFRQRSEDRIFALTSAIDGMKAQQKINEDMSRYDEQEKTKLKLEAELEHNRVKDLKARLEIRAKEQEEGHAALSRAKANYDQLNAKYLTLLADMEALRSEHKRQSQKLEEYSSISGVAVGQSFYDTSDKADGKRSTTSTTSSGSSPKLQLVKDAPKK